MRLGISSYTYVWSVGVPGFEQPEQPLSPIGLLAKAEELGVRVLQIADNLPLDRLSPAELDELAALARERRIDLEVGTAGVDAEQLRNYLQIAERLRSPIVRTVLDTNSCQPTPAEAVAAIASVLPDYCRAGVSLAIENHDRLPATMLANIVEQCDSRHVGICLDTANSLGCGEDLQTVLSSLSPFVLNLHIKDFRAPRLPHKKGFLIQGCPAGQGLVDVPRVLQELRSRNRDPSVILELWTPPESTLNQSIAKEEAWARQSITYLRQLISD